MAKPSDLPPSQSEALAGLLSAVGGGEVGEGGQRRTGAERQGEDSKGERLTQGRQGHGHRSPGFGLTAARRPGAMAASIT